MRLERDSYADELAEFAYTEILSYAVILRDVPQFSLALWRSLLSAKFHRSPVECDCRFVSR